MIVMATVHWDCEVRKLGSKGVKNNGAVFMAALQQFCGTLKFASEEMASNEANGFASPRVASEET
jgi:hypothetical protein